MKLAVFDFDSTLMDGETIDFLAKPLGLEEKVAAITEKAMAGELDFFESLVERVSLLKGLEYTKAVKICKDLPLMPGAYETVAKLKEAGYKVVCFSGGFRIGTTPAKEKLGLDADFSNILHEKNGVLTGLVGGDMMFGFSKGDMIQRVQALLGATKENTLVAGDGANDVSMFPYAAKRVAFCGREILKKEANIIVDTKDLTKILEYI
ncbi:phosphoserine phosphatase SerB [Halarcobacter ebronensis]|uniref:Phosphoserine phosphatase n=1 Tax=Halarcobacter ebronensis TaxID=1462615 RepID=A0A4Q1AKS3_9BACT|nr:phosphoserine phosphatase SerB [Halarcobacter ebronensis]QKF83178.1 phosphoserine phosphatase [Halarcobacter ebronensis]RXK05184.1 phosphoserine phosphatase SerB [Halarcobacter ebronensis]